jgi:hypothetical protein
MPPKDEPKKEEKKNDVKTVVALYGMIFGWTFTIGGFVWTVSAKDTQYEYRLNTIERELVNLDERLDAAETFRIEIRSDLAEIKTDLVWIRKELEKK